MEIDKQQFEKSQLPCRSYYFIYNNTVQHIWRKIDALEKQEHFKNIGEGADPFPLKNEKALEQESFALPWTP